MLMAAVFVGVIAQAPEPLTSDSFIPALVSYGVAGPLIAFMGWYIKQLLAQMDTLREELKQERVSSKLLAERLLDQQKELLPLANSMTSALNEAADSLAEPHDQRRWTK